MEKEKKKVINCIMPCKNKTTTRLQKSVFELLETNLSRIKYTGRKFKKQMNLMNSY
jgi:hypothetical protein